MAGAWRPAARPVASTRLRETAKFARRAEVVPGRYGNPPGAGPWRIIGKRAVSAQEKGLAEHLAAGALTSAAILTLWLRRDNFVRGLLTTDRILCRGQAWNITSISRVSYGDRFAQITAEVLSGEDAAEVMAAAQLETEDDRGLQTLSGAALTAV